MNQAVEDMLSRYQITNATDAENALKEIIQEIALLGLHRANFFEKAAFYGGTALRVLYGLPRFSEDLDFTLLESDLKFSLSPYFSAVQRELGAFGFQVEVSTVDKNIKSKVDSAFIKANTKMHLLKIKSLKEFESKTQSNSKIQIKFEVDINPVVNFQTEARYLLNPTSFPIISLKKPDLFGGKLHAVLFRNWKNRIKGRDFYDYVWYLKNETPVRLSYLREKALQSGHIKRGELENLKQLKNLIIQRLHDIDMAQAKDDVLPFIKDPAEVSVWSKKFFTQITERLTVV
jgi:predicted nucleotidyltransferase component of viral defense system